MSNKTKSVLLTVIIALLFAAVLFWVALVSEQTRLAVLIPLAVYGYLAFCRSLYTFISADTPKEQKNSYTAPAQNKAYDCMADIKDEEKRAEDAYWDQLIAEIEKAPAQKIETDASSLM